MSYVRLYMEIIAPAQWFHSPSSEIFRKLTTISLAMRSKDLLSGRLVASGKAIVNFQNVSTQITNTPEGFWFKRNGHGVNDILSPYAGYWILADIPIEWAHPGSNVLELRNIVMVAVAAKKYKCFGSENGGLVFLRHKNILAEVEAIRETVYIMKRRSDLPLVNDYRYSAQQLLLTNNNTEQECYEELVWK
ncbi:uncharacterized protein LOC122508723 [Leptopilina heterotoma]|uniref:uncharacterized protein LOC122508723 n=1 Tax=Leptopilina heterotoma TaxID=63436 RepID=UPI001CA9881B|nr:uncharacterized protein LOC122508723 [Leptopilina heterotoma]